MGSSHKIPHSQRYVVIQFIVGYVPIFKGILHEKRKIILIFVYRHKSCICESKIVMQRLRLILLLLPLLCLLANAAQVAYVRDDYQTRALFIYNFTRYLDWRSESNREISIGVLGDEVAFRAVKQMFSNKSTPQRAYYVRRFRGVQELRECRILFIADTAISNNEIDFGYVMEKVRGKHTLLITETVEGIKRGSGINFVLVHRKLNFQINAPRLRKEGIKVAHRLVRMSVNH